ncbi:MAG: transcription termination/antitermination protein NusA [Blastocatellia bacterium]|jgi:N utilization substance protein A|nr:transcription termination/antitermination protein NusA [Blastocatellia bacterium]
MSTSIAQNIEALCQEQGIDRELVVEAIKEAVRAAAKKQFKGGEDIQVDWSPESGLELSASKVVVDDVADPSTELSIAEARELGGDEVEVGDALLLPMPMEELGRIAAQTAKQILFQKVRDAVRSNVYEQYIDRVGELVNGFVKRFERGNMIVDLGNLEAILPRSQQSRGEQWNQGERIRVVITNVSKESKGPQIEVSRTSPELLERLFEMEVPEIYDGTVVIKSCVREPGERAKIAVVSNERDVDPVGACVGMKGSRVQAIIRELRGEKIDIIEWSEEPSVFAANSLSPAKVNQVRITDIENRQMEVIVNEDQLSLAIGKRGQNVRLATKLVGWNIDIRSEEELKKEVAEQMGAMIASGAPVPLAAIQVVTAQQAETLGEHGVTDIDGLVNTSVDDLVEFLDVSLDEAENILSAARSVIEVRERAKQSATPEGDESEAATTAGEAETGVPSDETEVEVVATDAETSPDPTAAGYDEAVESGVPFSAEQNIRAEYSADPVALSEADPMTVDELVLQDAGRDLRPDVITPAPDVTSLAVADLEARLEEEVAASGQDDARIAESAATETGSALESSSDDEAATDESLKDEKQ